jgi:hypothetical protein
MKLPRGVGPKTIQALRIVRDNEPLKPTRFAELMWPESPAWKIHYNCGPYGSTTGRGLVMSAGSFLWKMERLGLTNRIHRRLAWDHWNYDWFITGKGRDLLKEIEGGDRGS